MITAEQVRRRARRGDIGLVQARRELMLEDRLMQLDRIDTSDVHVALSEFKAILRSIIEDAITW